MRDGRATPAVRQRRTLGRAGLAAIVAGLALLPTMAFMSAPARYAALTVAHAPAVKPVTVTGHTPLWDDVTGKPYTVRPTVTVSQASKLTTQLVQVSWSHFTPSVFPSDQAYYVSSADSPTLYPVMVAECKGTNPTPADCFGAQEEGIPQTQAPPGWAGQPNTAYAVTQHDGNGQANIDLENGAASSSLQCDPRHTCSLVVVSAQGGEPGKCSDHSQDTTFAAPAAAFPLPAGEKTTGVCSWDDRVVVPLKFSALPGGCPDLAHPAFTVGGSQMMYDALQQWIPGYCARRGGGYVNYNGQLSEPSAVLEAASSAGDESASTALNVALTTRTAKADDVSTSKPFIYAPIGVTAGTVAYWIDQASTGKQLSGLKLNQRLLLKLLTTSYDPVTNCPPPAPNVPCDPHVEGNPFNMYLDPEFTKLNGAISKAVGLFGPQPWTTPTVQFGAADLTWTVTSWIHANPAASAFLRGQTEQDGTFKMHVNTAYSGKAGQYPTNEFQALDTSTNPLWAQAYEPAQLLAGPGSSVASDQALNLNSGRTVANQVVTGQPTSYSADPPESAGDRSLIAIVDEADAALDRFPVAEIPNAAGKWVLPSNTTMAHALDHMTLSDGALQVNQSNTDPRAYPLTMVVYAMVPTSGLSHTKAVAISNWLKWVAGPAQQVGQAPGELPAGYLPLPANLRQQTDKLAVDVANQTGQTKPGSPAGSGNPTSTPSPGGGLAPTVAATPSTSPSASLALPGTHGNGPISLLAAHPSPTGFLRFALPLLLILGGVAALAGSSLLASAGEGGVGGTLRQLGHSLAAGSAAAAAAVSTARAGRSGQPPPPASESSPKHASLDRFRLSRFTRGRKP